MALVAAPDSAQKAASDMIIRGFGFTGAEGKVAYRLAQGKSPEGCADELGVTVSTVRSHLKNMMLKTGTKRQAELVGLLLKNFSLMCL